MGFTAAWFLVVNFICSYGCCSDIAYDYGVPAWYAIPRILVIFLSADLGLRYIVPKPKGFLGRFCFGRRKRRNFTHRWHEGLERRCDLKFSNP